MPKFLLAGFVFFCAVTTSFGQRLLSWAPEFPLDNSNITITVDCNKGNQGLLNFEGGNSNNVYVHVGVITNLSTGASDWKYVKFNWGTADAAAKATPLGSNKYSYTINNIRTFFNVPAAETIRKICILFRNANGNNSIKQANSDNSDMYVPVYGASEFAVRFNAPVFEPRFVPFLEPVTAVAGSTLTLTGVSSANANLTLKLNGTVVGTAANSTTITASPVLPNICTQRAVLEGVGGGALAKDSFDFYVAPATVTQALPAGVQEGINYISPTSVTLVLFAPGKSSVVALGDFSNWIQDCAYQMKRTPDGNYFHTTLTGLTSGQLYRFQYIVDGNIKTNDPYTELVLDPNNDGFIPATNYPNLPAYPAGLTTGIVSTFQTNAPQYTWTATGYTRPDKKNLVVYELLLRDFLANSNWQTLTDTLDYLKRLGINAIELMPFNEFEGNLSWGYNPSFFFAPDKYYGTKNALKKLIDEAHKKGMAVIMDAVLNHATGLSPLAQMWWDGASNRPAANSPYFNVTPTHPFNVFNDFNHSSAATKYHVARYIRHWLTEYRLDGFRWDLSKGFTQTNCGSDVNCWNNYDAGRVANWQRYYDSMQAVSPGSYCILEHLGNDNEEADLAGRGMLLWGKMTDQYNQNSMGFGSNSDISRAYYKNRSGWTQPHLVTYAESHDEERMMYKNSAFGNQGTAHNVKDIPTALLRTEALNAFLLMMPGPKMLWQFEELGYDKSIFSCPDGTVPSPYGNDQCKLGNKQILWNYQQDINRKRLYDVTAAFNKLRAAKPNTFLSSNVTGIYANTLAKTLVIQHPDMHVVLVGNFDVSVQDVPVIFPSTGTWYEYIPGTTQDISNINQTFKLQPGQYRLFINQNIASGVVLPPGSNNNPGTELKIKTYPNPVAKNATIEYSLPEDGMVSISLYNSMGARVLTVLSESKLKGTYTLPVNKLVQALAAGRYTFRIEQNGAKALSSFLKL